MYIFKRMKKKNERGEGVESDFKSPLKYARFLKPFVYSKMLLIILLLLAQFAIYLTLILRFERFIPYLGWTNLALSILFLSYLANKQGKNEFKLAWLFPILIFPFFGIVLYFMCKVNFG